MNVVKNVNLELKIVDEFKSLIRPLLTNEYEQIEDSLKKDGCLSPIVIWGSKNIILDGHNRYEICSKNNIEFKTIKLEFLNENDAKIWVINNQFSRRNLSTYERSMLALKLDSIIKEKARENQLSGLKQTPVHQKSDEREVLVPVNTNYQLSKIAGVSHDTIAKVRKIEEFADNETKTKLLNNSLSVNEAYQKTKKIFPKITVTCSNKKNEKVEKVNVLCADFFVLKDLTEPSITNLLCEDSTVFIWSSENELANTFKMMRKIGLKYVRCLVWDRGEEKSPMFFIVSCFGKPSVVKQKVLPVYRENSSDDTKKPEYYNDLIKKMFSDNEIIKRLI